MAENEVCPKCGAELSPEEETASGRKLRRCSKGAWNKETRKVEGCGYAKWLPVEPVTLEEMCPKCKAPLVLSVTRFGKRMKKCSTSGWDKEAKKPTGCDFIEWINGTKEALDEVCPQCGKAVVLVTTARGKRMKKCSTSGWDKENRVSTGCPFIQWL
jgi:ssDNA-binding Zn-finger/Zn-ribbon topoisomerase 1